MSISKWNVPATVTQWEIFNKLFRVPFPFVKHWNSVSSFSCMKHPFIMFLFSHPTFPLWRLNLYFVYYVFVCCFTSCCVSDLFEQVLEDKRWNFPGKKFMLSFQFRPQRFAKRQNATIFLPFSWYWNIYECGVGNEPRCNIQE